MTHRGVQLARFGSAFVAGALAPTLFLLPTPGAFSLAAACAIGTAWAWLRLRVGPQPFGAGLSSAPE